MLLCNFATKTYVKMSLTQIIGKVFVPRQKALEKNKSYIRKRKEPKREKYFPS